MPGQPAISASIRTGEKGVVSGLTSDSLDHVRRQTGKLDSIVLRSLPILLIVFGSWLQQLL